MNKSCVLAYSGGLDTSVLLGWLGEQGYSVHAVYVDLGQPCEDRQAILHKAKKIGAKSARIVDVQNEMCRDLRFPFCSFRQNTKAYICSELLSQDRLFPKYVCRLPAKPEQMLSFTEQPARVMTSAASNLLPKHLTQLSKSSLLGGTQSSAKPFPVVPQ